MSLTSSRIANYECINGENLHGWFTGDGMTYLYLGNPESQFAGAFWPTVDPYHLPGTTVDTTVRADGSGQGALSSQNWVGGAQVAQAYGVAGMALAAYGSTLTAKKSWLMFDDEIVCLGAGITCGGTNAIHTTVEDRQFGISPTNVFTINGVASPTTVGWSSNLPPTSWCSLGGVAGYYFPAGATNLQATLESRVHSWSEINSGTYVATTTNLHTSSYLKLWFNHGIKPTNLTYAYVILPNATTAGMSNYAAAPKIMVLTNTATVQAASKPSLGVAGANFWVDGTNSAGGITVNKKSSVITRETTEAIEVAVADPTQTNTGSIVVTLDRPATWLISCDAGITVQQLAPQIRFSVAVNGAKGKSFCASFSTTSANPNPTWDAAPGASGPQDGSGVWNAVSSNWWNGVTNVIWNDAAAPIATFGNGGTAGTVTVAGSHSADSLVFNPVTNGSYTLAGSSTLTVGHGITANSTATLNLPLNLPASQSWTVAPSQLLNVNGAIATPGPDTLSLAGAGTVNLAGTNQLSLSLTDIVFQDTTNKTTLGIAGGTQSIASLSLNDGVNAAVSGSGSLLVSGAADFALGGTTAGSAQTLDLSGLRTFVFSNPSKLFRVGGQISGIGGAVADGFLALAKTNFITASTFGVGNRSRSVSASAWNIGSLTLGSYNSIQADTIQIGGNQAFGTVNFATNLPANPVLIIRGSAGGESRASITVGTGQSSNYEPTQGTVNLVSGVNGASQLDALVETLTLGEANYGNGTPAFGSLSMGAGTLDATSIIIGRRFSNSTGSGSVTGALTNSGGVLKARTLTLGSCEVAAGSAVTATLVLQAGANLKASTVQPGTSLGTGTMKRNFLWNDGTIGNLDTDTDLSIASGLTLVLTNGGAHTFDLDANRTGTIDAVLSGSGGLTKSGSGTLIMTGDNTYAGATTVSNGTLLINGTLAGTGVVTVAKGAQIGGAGRISGPVTVVAGGVLSPGVSVGTLTISNNLTIAGDLVVQINKSFTPSNDLVIVIGILTNAGTGTVTAVNLGSGALAVGDRFRLFSKPILNGGALSITSSGLVWTNRLAVDGSIEVISTVSATPTNLIATMVGGNLNLTWPANHIGWRLEVQTNALSTGLNTNWFTWPGSTASNTVVIPVNPANPAFFFRLAYP